LVGEVVDIVDLRVIVKYVHGNLKRNR
jgi:hypothetical protein